MATGSKFIIGMKRIIVAVCALCLALSGAKAQKVLKDNINGETAPATTTGNGSGDDYGDVMNGGISFGYQALDGGYGMEFNMVFNHLMLTGSLISGETNNYVTKNDGWRAGLGYNYRYWLGKSVFIEGAVGIEYSHASVEVKTYTGTSKTGRAQYETAKASDGNWGLFLYPRIGTRLFKIADVDYGLYAGYRWDFNEFKFSKEYTADYFTVGIIGIF